MTAATAIGDQAETAADDVTAAESDGASAGSAGSAQREPMTNMAVITMPKKTQP